MRFEFIVDEHVKIKTFLKKHEVSKGLLAKIKFISELSFLKSA